MVNATNLTAVTSVVDTVKSYAFTIIIGIVILIVGFIIGIVAQKFLQKILHELDLNKFMYKLGFKANLEKMVSSIISYVIYLFTVVIFLDQIGLKSVVLYILAGGVLMLLILTSLVGLKDVIPNFVAWFILQRKGKMREGHRVDVKEISGTIERIGFLETEIKTESNDILYVPNSLFLKSKTKVRK